MDQLKERLIYQDFEIKVFVTETGYRLQAFKGTKAYYPVVSLDFDTAHDMKLQNYDGVGELVAFLKSQIDQGFLRE